ncbi:DUF7659 family protein [Cellvibrio sp. QJXJ]|uniref:DUF7659 family protein n=1 Tax=Cellvibrio sp. QJXJ TaxID=2964606 RepID=UPI0021C37E53|nr:hypothetical protein [Cellvibrio sp. QJXJ]UUA75157.1 hypothetical protein NNX04_22125 [Cellvibrio sp. QJXJ]
MQTQQITASVKNLYDYIDELQNKLLADNGAFFATPTAWAQKQKVEGVSYVGLKTLLSGCVLCPADNASELDEKLKCIRQTAIAYDLAKNGKDGVIQREIAEAGLYRAKVVLKEYGITWGELLNVATTQFKNAV